MGEQGEARCLLALRDRPWLFRLRTQQLSLQPENFSELPLSCLFPFPWSGWDLAPALTAWFHPTSSLLPFTPPALPVLSSSLPHPLFSPAVLPAQLFFCLLSTCHTAHKHRLLPKPSTRSVQLPAFANGLPLRGPLAKKSYAS